MNWIAFKDEVPEKGQRILYGNHRGVECALFYPENVDLQQKEILWKPVTHWCYIDLPPVVVVEKKW